MIESLIRRLRQVVQSDARIAELAAERDELKAERAKFDRRIEKSEQAAIRKIAARPSFYLYHKHLTRGYGRARATGRMHPIWTLDPKREAYRFAVSHGIDVPEQLGEFAQVADLRWDELPDAFVVKANTAGAAHGVLPLVRREGRYRDLLNVQRDPMSADEITDYFYALADGEKVSSDGVIEELLLSPHHDYDTPSPDVKLYCFYGEVGMVMHRFSNGSRNHRDISFRFFDAEGNDLGDALHNYRTDTEAPAPLHLAELVDAGRRLSLALKVPFVRLDFFERKDGIVFGELTPCPGGQQRVRADIDKLLGRSWLDAEIRLSNDLNRSGLLNPEPGPHGAETEG